MCVGISPIVTKAREWGCGYNSIVGFGVSSTAAPTVSASPPQKHAWTPNTAYQCQSKQTFSTVCPCLLRTLAFEQKTETEQVQGNWDRYCYSWLGGLHGDT